MRGCDSKIFNFLTMYKLTKLKNGVRVLTVPMSGVGSVTTLVMVGAGARYETPKINGLSHFLEHMFFKGTKKRPTAQDISSVIDGIGGEFNAFTSKEYTGFYVKAAKKHMDLSLDVLSDMLLHSKLESAEIEKEKGVIVEEINLYEDTPMRRIGDVFEELLYGDQPLGRAVLGTKDVIKSLRRDDFVSYIKGLYKGGNVIVGVAGGIKDEQLAVKSVERYFGGLENEKVPHSLAVKDEQCQPKVLIKHKKTDQAHLSIGVRAFEVDNPKRYAMSVLSTILGGNMSSRLFIQVREKRGLAYYVRSGADHYKDAGYFVTQAGLDINRIEEAIKVILDEYSKVTQVTEGTRVTEEELRRAKEYIKGKMVLELEDSQSLAGLYVSQALLEKEIKTVEEIMKRIDVVTKEDVVKVAGEVFKNERLNLAIIGPFEDGKKFEKLLRFN